MGELKSNRKIKSISFVDYCFNKAMRLNTPFLIRDGKGYYILEGVHLVPQLEFEALYPVPSRIYTVENPDGTFIY